MLKTTKLPSWMVRALPRGSRRPTRRPLLGPERLEDRCVLSGGVLDWAQLGPFPQTNPKPNGGVSTGEATSGRVSSLAFGNYDDLPALEIWL